MDRDGERLRECFTMHGEEARRRIQALLDDRREGTPHERELHLVCDAVEFVAHDLKCDRIEG